MSVMKFPNVTSPYKTLKAIHHTIIKGGYCEEKRHHPKLKGNRIV